MAIYDKKFGERDRKITSFFIWDYIYRKNLILRIGITIGYAIVVGFLYAHKIFVANEDIFSMFNKDEFIKLGVILIFILAVYSIIGIFMHIKTYKEAERRQQIYEGMVEKLEERGNEKNIARNKNVPKIPKEIEMSMPNHQNVRRAEQPSAGSSIPPLRERPRMEMAATTHGNVRRAEQPSAGSNIQPLREHPRMEMAATTHGNVRRAKQPTAENSIQPLREHPRKAQQNSANAKTPEGLSQKNQRKQ
ncbi:MAG: hypothetical protein HFE62_05205 [Firmicutes bacterium]|nr:hypothetical protein [Bacillota bacterium]